MRYAGAVGGRGRVAFSPAMVAGRPGSGAGRAWLRAHATARPWRRWPAGHRQRAEPSRAGAPRSWRRALVACLLCFGALCFGAPVDTAAAQEPEITTFLDNTISGRRSCGARRYTSDITVVQGFNTGGHRTGYTLREIEFEVKGHPDSFTVYPHITLAEASPLFVSEVATLTYNRKRSVDYAHSVNTMVTYTVPEDVTLDPLVAYYLKFASPGQAGYSIAFSRKKSYRVERPNQYGWSMVSTLYWQRSGWNYYNHLTFGGIPCGIRITAVGYRNVDGPNRLPTSANGRIAAGQGRDYVFGRSDFTFSDPDTLDPFSGLEITLLPDSGAGTLKLDGSALGAQDLPKTVTRSELDSGKFVYTPPSGEPEENIASFGFKVSDGMATSDSSYTMSISRVLPRAVLVSIEPTSTPTRWRPGTESGSSAPDTYGNGDIVEITATFDGDITVSDVPQFMFRYRGDIWLGHNKYFVHSQYDPVRSAAAGRNKAVFTYRVTDPSEFTPGNTGIQIVRKAPCCPGGNPFRLYGEDAIDSANGGGPARLGIANDTVYFGHKFNAGLGSRPPENQAPTSAIGRITATQGAQYAFSVSDFDYHDEDADLLAAIKIVSPPTAGELLLDGSDVAAGASVTRAELDEGALIYRAPEETTGADVASFTFKVSDGLHESATDYAMNIDVQASGQQVEVDAPTIDGTPRVSGAGDDGRWTQGETVRVTIPFSEAVEVDMSGGTPSVGIDLGGTATRSAAYRSGSGTAELAFDYTLVQEDGAHSTMAVTPNSLALNGGTIRGSESQADAQLAHNGAVVQGGSDRDDGPEASFRNVPKSHDGESGFTVGLQFSGEPSGLSAKRDAASVLELTGGTVTGARRTDGGEQPAWEVTVQPDGPGDIMLRLPARACDETHAVCIEGEPLDEAAQAMVPGTPLTAQFTQAPETHDGSNAFEVDMDFSHEPAGLSYRTVRDALFDVEGGRIERAQRRERGRNRLWRIRVVPETSGDVTLAVRTTTDCAAPYAACGANGRKLAGNARLTVRGPASPTAPAVSVAPPAATPVTEGAALGFALTRTGETTQALTVTVSVTETGTTLSGTPPASATFASGSDRAVLSVATEDDEASEAASTVTATVSPGEGYTVEDASASAQAVVEDDDAVPVVSTASPIVVAENRTAVVTLTATDADTAAEALAWSLPEGETGGTDAAQFTLSAEGALAFRAAKDFEAPDDANADGDYEVTVRVTDGTNAIDTALVVRLADVEDAAPAVSTASPIVVAENQTAVATLTATDADTAAEALAWSLPEGESGGTDAAQFTLSAEGALAFRAAKDFEAPDDANADGDYEVTVRVTDGSNPVDVPLVVRLADVEDAAPAVSTASPIVVAENQTAVVTLTATDADTAAEALAWSLPEGGAGGADAAQFTLSAQGALAFRAAKDFEAPDDADGNGDYEVTVRVTDGSNPVDVPLVVRLADVEDAAPAVSTASPIVVAENQTAVATLTATDADTAAEALAWSLPEGESGGTDAAQFTLSAEGALAFRAAKDFEAPDDANADGDYEVTVRVTDGSNPVDVPLVVRLADVEDAAPAVSTASPIVVAENQTAVATLTATDADTAAEALAWSLPEGESGGTDAAQFTLSAEGALAFRAAKDFEAPDDANADGDYEVTVRVTDGTNAVDTALVVRLADVDDAAPSLSGVSVDGGAMALAFDEPLDEESVPPASSFAVIADGSERPVDAVEVSGGTVVVTFSPSARAGETVTVGYTVPTEPGTAPLRDAEGNRVASFASAETENRTTLTVVSIGAASTPVTEGAVAAFVLTRTGATAAALTVAVSVTEAGSVVNGATPSSATFAAGASEARLTVATVNDGVHETDARLTASIQGADGYEVEEGARSAVVDVFDDDAAAPPAPPATELWSSTLIWSDLGNNWFGGFAEAFSDPEWTEGGQDFRIWYIAYYAGSRELSMAHRGVGGVIGEPGQLALHVGGLTIGAGDALSAFARAAVARVGGIASQWRAGEQVSVRLTRTVGEAAPVAAGPGLSVADAQVNESAGVPLRFRVTLDAPAQSAVSVRYRTADGSARAVEDYAPAHGAVRFAPGETAKTVAVAVVKDTHDEGSETMTLTLYRPSGASVGDGAATGTIVNTGPMPKAWIARFGRTVAEQAVEAVEARFEAARAPGLSGSIAGQQLSGPSGAGAEDAEARAAEMETRLGLETFADWLSGKSGEEADAEAFESRTLTGREVLAGSTFALTGGTAETGLASFWGRGAVTRFDGREGELSVDGEVASAMLGADWTRDRVLAGLMLSHSRGEGGYRDGSGTGEVESTLTALFPYARYALSERVSVWGMAGYGEGTLTLTPEGQAPMRPDMDLVMGAVGARGVLVEGGTEGPTLAATSDAFAVRTSTDAVSGSGAGKLAAAQADVTRVRLGLKGSQPLRLGGDAVLTPSLELGVRHDGGDAETGFGADIGAGLALAAPSRGLSAEIRARGLLTHEADGMREWGVSGTLAWDPAPDSDRGLSLSLSQTVGAQASGGADALFARPTLAGLGAEEDEGPLGRRLDARLGYGLGVFDDRWTATPELGLGLSDTGRELRLGWRITERVAAGLAFELGVEGTRRESVDGAANPEHGLEVGLGWRLVGARASHAAFEMRLQAARREAANDNRAPEDTIMLELTARW